MKFNFDELNISDFRSMVSTNYHAATEFYSNRRNQKSFKASCGMIFDFDSKNGSVGSSIDEFLNSDVAKTFSFMLYTSKSHRLGENGDCYHVFFPFSRAVTNPFEYTASVETMKTLLELDNLIYDNQALHGYSRLLSPSAQTAVTGETQFKIIKRIGVCVDPTESDFIEEPEEEYEYTYNSEWDDNFFYGKAFNFIDRTYKFNIINKFCKHINEKNRTSGWKFFTSKSDWITFAAIFHNLFGFELGKRLFITMSRGFKNSDGVEDSFDTISGTFDMITRDRDQKLGFVKFMNMTKKYKFYLNFTIKKAVMSRITASNSIPLTELVSHILKDHFNCDRVVLRKIWNNRHTQLYTEIWNGESSTITSIGPKALADIMAIHFGINRRFLYEVYDKLCEQVTDTIDLYGIVYTRLKKAIFKYNGETSAISIKKMNEIIDGVNKEYNPNKGLRVDHMEVTRRLYNRCFIGSLSSDRLWDKKQKKMISLIFCKNELSTKSQVEKLSGDVVVKASKRFMINDRNGYIGSTASDVIFTLSTNSGIRGEKFKDGSVYISDIIGGNLPDHAMNRDSEFVKLLKSIYENSRTDYILQFHWDISNPGVSRRFRKYRTVVKQNNWRMRNDTRAISRIYGRA